MVCVEEGCSLGLSNRDQHVCDVLHDAAPELLGDRAQGPVGDFVHADQATEGLVLVVDLDAVADFLSSVVVLTIG